MYHVMKDFHLCGWLLSYDLSKTSAKLVISLKHNIFFAKFCEILLDNNIIGYTHSLTKQKSFGSYLSLYFPIFYTCLDFRWLTKSIETIKLYKRSFSPLFFLVFVFLWSIPSTGSGFRQRTLFFDVHKDLYLKSLRLLLINNCYYSNQEI